MVCFHIPNVPQPFSLIFFFFFPTCLVPPIAPLARDLKTNKGGNRRLFPPHSAGGLHSAKTCRALFISLDFTLLHSPSFASPSVSSPLHPPPPPPLSSEVPLFILTPQPVNLRSLDGHLSAPHHRAAPCRSASQPAGLDPTAPHSLISPPAVASLGLEARRQSAASHLFPIAPSPPSPKCLDGQRTTSQARGKAARQDVGEVGEVQEGMKGKDGETDWWRDSSAAEPRALLPCERRH